MKYDDNGEYKNIYVKSFDTLPVGTEVDFDGNSVPSGWTQVNNVLYYNASGDNGTIVLSDSASNYNYLEIFYGSAVRYLTSTKLDLSINNGGTLTEIHSDNNGAMYFNTRTITISGTTLATDGTRYSSGQTGAWNNWSNTNNINIYKVIGYKE